MGPPIHFIHMSGKHHTYNGVWRTLYAVDGHKDSTPACMAQDPAAVCHIDSG